MIDNKTIRKVVIADKLFPGGSRPTYEDRTVSGAIATFETNVAMPLNSCNCIINPLQEGTGDPSPENPRPIIGTSVLNVEKRGVNLFDPSTVFSNQGAYICAQGIFPRNITLNMSFVDKDPSVSISGLYFGFVDEEYVGGSPSGHYRWAIDNGNINENKTNIAAATQNFCNGLIAFPQSQTTIDTLLARFDIQIELGTTATAFEPYTGSTYTVNLGRTVYGGSADVVGGTGESEWGYIASYNGETITEPWLSSIDAYAEGTLPSTGAEVVYKLATPTDFTFEGEEINSYLGVNNLYHDGNGDIEVSYKYQTGTRPTSKVNKWLPIFYPIRKEDT